MRGILIDTTHHSEWVCLYTQLCGHWIQNGVLNRQ